MINNTTLLRKSKALNLDLNLKRGLFVTAMLKSSPLPAVILGAIGMGFASWKLRKRKEL
jgi:hypothetical protein